LTLSIRDVVYVPELGLNLISCSRLAARGISSIFHHNGCDLMDKNDHDDIISKENLVDDLHWTRERNPLLLRKHCNFFRAFNRP
jgi:hypothetical protein